ncbi:hypothetical protein [Paenibacillus sp. DMB20]|uniref:hypothetical protein n=1 Tax=Paenibacillus sp. DMB20 TaxID=1642570 RepID=UPI000627D094|nr:hypothetical protein [Paenibacillus sp. DMB20]KKO53462.1 hypothetical protein XI25_12740 [Paenibacillus sp. DMB20]
MNNIKKLQATQALLYMLRNWPNVEHKDSLFDSLLDLKGADDEKVTPQVLYMMDKLGVLDSDVTQKAEKVRNKKKSSYR